MPSTLGDLVEAVGEFHLTTYEASIRRADGMFDDFSATGEAAEMLRGDRELELDIALAGQYAAGGDFVATRLRLTVDSVAMQAAIDLAAFFPHSLGEVVPQDVLKEFSSEVGIMALLPYAREALNSLSSRAGVPIHMPVMTRQKAKEVVSWPDRGATAPGDEPAPDA